LAQAEEKKKPDTSGREVTDMLKELKKQQQQLLLRFDNLMQALEKKRPDPEVIEGKTPAPVPVYSGATVNIIRNLKNQEYKFDPRVQQHYNDSCCLAGDTSCCFPPLEKQ